MARLDPVSRQEEQVRDTAVCREACLDPAKSVLIFYVLFLFEQVRRERH